MELETQVVVIGGGATGTAVLRDRRDTPAIQVGHYGSMESDRTPVYVRGAGTVHYKGMISDGADTVYLEDVVDYDDYTQQIQDLHEVVHMAWAGNDGVIPAFDEAFFAVTATSPASMSVSVADGMAFIGGATAPVVADAAQSVGPFEAPSASTKWFVR